MSRTKKVAMPISHRAKLHQYKAKEYPQRNSTKLVSLYVCTCGAGRDEASQ